MAEQFQIGSSDGTNVKKPKKSLGRQCVVFGCYQTFYKKDGSKSGVHFFKFPQTNPEKNRWCNLIKRQDGKDNFKVSANTYVCQHHFKDSDIKRNPNTWRLKKGAEPSQNLYQSVTYHQMSSRKPPKKRILLSPPLSPVPMSSLSKTVPIFDEDGNDEMLVVGPHESTNLTQNNVSDNGTQTSFSFVDTPIYLDPTPIEISVAQDHAYTMSSFTNNVMFNIFSEYDCMKSELEKSAREINKLKEKLASLREELNSSQSRDFNFDKIKKERSNCS